MKSVPANDDTPGIPHAKQEEMGVKETVSAAAMWKTRVETALFLKKQKEYPAKTDRQQARQGQLHQDIGVLFKIAPGQTPGG
jgi:hypothetical protein